MTFGSRQSILVCTVLFAISGCAATQPPRAYLLGHLTKIQAIDIRELGLPLVELKPVLVPDFLDTRDIVFRKGANELVVDPAGQWADRLSVGVRRAVGDALTLLLTGMDITAGRPDRAATWQVLIDVDLFELRADAPGAFGAKWTVVRASDQVVQRAEYTRLVVTPVDGGDDAAAAAMTKALDELANRIAAALAELARGT